MDGVRATLSRFINCSISVFKVLLLAEGSPGRDPVDVHYMQAEDR